MMKSNLSSNTANKKNFFKSFLSKVKNTHISIKYKIWLAIMSTVLVVVGTLWMLQVVFLEKFYLKNKSLQMVKNAKEIIEAINEKGLDQSGDDLIRVGLNNTLCIDILSQDGKPYVRYEGLGENCAIHVNGDIRYKILLKALNNPEEFIITDVRHPQFDIDYYNCAVFSKMDNGNNYVIMVTATLSPIKEAAIFVRTQLLYISIVLVMVATAIAFLVARTMTKPIKKISNAAKEIANGNLEVDVNVSTNDEIGELSESFQYMTKELAKVQVLQKELIANISHDIRTPLTMIKGYAETIKDITGDDKQTRERQLDIIVDESNRLTKLVSDVMDLSLMQAGQSPLNITEFDICKTTSEILKRFELLEQTKGFEFSLIADDNYIVVADEVRIEQVLYNLINNAVNHIGVEKRITVRIINEFDEVKVEVIDTGVGIKQEDLPLIWDRYYKPYKNTQQESRGTGLGLSIVKAILINHNSRFGVKSVISKGSTFWFTLKKKT